MTLRWVWLAAACAAVGCGLEAPARGTPLGGSPLGVARARFEVRARPLDLLPVDVFFPADADGVALPAEGGRPALVYVQGGAVPSADYHWMAERLAGAGYVVAVPSVASQLALFSVDDGEAARWLLVDPPPGSVLEGLVDASRIAVAGHSLGGVVAGKLALGGGFRALVLHASFTDPADDARLPGLDMPVLSLGGSADCSARPDSVREGFAKLPAPSALVLLPGVGHFQFTSQGSTDRGRGCAPGVPLEVAHDGIVRTTRAFLDAALGGKPLTVDGLSAVPGVEVETR
jgi:pimeloyl-ACP methyl ester carboxylesterase